MTPAPDPAVHQLGHRSANALGWNYIGTFVRGFMQLAVGVLFARLLGPEAFGEVAIGWLIIGLGALFADLGLGFVIVQRRHLSQGDVNFVHTAQVAIGLSLTLLTLCCSRLLASWLGQPNAANVIAGLSPLFLIQSFGATSLALMRRELDFRTPQMIGIASYLFGYVAVGVPFALFGMGSWTLVAAQVTQSVLIAAFAFRKRRLRISLVPADSSIWASGLRLTGANVVNWALANLDSVAISRSLGVDALGLYGRALALAQVPGNSLVAGLQGVLFAACSRAQTDLPRLRRAYLTATSLMAGIALPLFLTAAAVPEAVILGIYGSKWAGSVAAFCPISLAMASLALVSLPGPVLNAMNRTEVEIRVQVVLLVALALALLFTSQWSLAAVAWTVFGMQMIRAVLLSWMLLKRLGGGWFDWCCVLLWPAIISLPTVVLTFFADHFSLGLPSSWRLALDVLTAAIALGLAYRLFGPRWFQALPGGHDFARLRLPPAVLKWLRIPLAADAA